MPNFNEYMDCFKLVSKGMLKLRPLSPAERDNLKKGYYGWYDVGDIELDDFDENWSKAANLYGRDTLVWLL